MCSVQCAVCSEQCALCTVLCAVCCVANLRQQQGYLGQPDVVPLGVVEEVGGGHYQGGARLLQGGQAAH